MTNLKIYKTIPPILGLFAIHLACEADELQRSTPERQTSEIETNSAETETDSTEVPIPDDIDMVVEGSDFSAPGEELPDFSDSQFIEVDLEESEPISVTFVNEPLSLANNIALPAISANEPMAEGFSLENAIRSLDSTSLRWQSSRGCFSCHTNIGYLPARLLTTKEGPSLTEVRDFAVSYAQTQWSNPAYVVPLGFTLAYSDKYDKEALTTETTEVLNRMWELQDADGGFAWFLLNKPPSESDDHYAVTMAAIATGVAPGYAASAEAQAGLTKIRAYLSANAADNLHKKLMLLWAESYDLALLESFDPAQTVAEILALQRDDGGFSLDDLWSETTPNAQHVSDGYATGLVLYVLSLTNQERTEAIDSAVQWLLSNQRESGRWFTPSVASSSNLITNVGTAYAIMGLAAWQNFEVIWPTPAP